ncbi:MAG: hypothetical protein LUC32_08820 [Clostridiales bacterium]|nr:hypothetical protein [Clostridiales bacterium]
MDKISVVLELILSAILIVVTVMAIIFLKTPLLEYIANASDSQALLAFITYVINILIVIELFKMLCIPGTDTVLEVMTFVIVRHMIVQETTAVENLLTVIAVVLIILVRKFVLEEKKPKFRLRDKDREDEET